MSTIPRAGLERWPATPLAVMTIRSYGLTAILYGLLVISQDNVRWSGPTYAMALVVAPQVVWGSVITALGLIIVVGSLSGRFLLRNIGLYGMAIFLVGLGFTIARSAQDAPAAPYAGVALLVGFAVNACIVARAEEARR